MPVFAILLKGLIYSIITFALIGCSRDNTVTNTKQEKAESELFCLEEEESPFDVNVFNKIELLDNELNLNLIDKVDSSHSLFFNHDLLSEYKLNNPLFNPGAEEMYGSTNPFFHPQLSSVEFESLSKNLYDNRNNGKHNFNSLFFKNQLQKFNYVNELNAKVKFDASKALYTLPEQFVSYLSDQYTLNIKPISVSDPLLISLNTDIAKRIKEREDAIDKQEKDDGVKTKDKSLKFDFEEYIARYQTEIEFRTAVIEVTSLQEIQPDLDKVNNITNVDMLLDEGWNSIVIKVTITMNIPSTGLECNLSPGDIEEGAVFQRLVTIEAPYILNILRGGNEEFEDLKASIALENFESKANDKFGTNISISGDYLAVGLPEDDSELQGVFSLQDKQFGLNQASNSGAVYLYKFIDGDYVPLAFIKASNSEADDRFGYSVSLDENILIVSAIDEDSSAEGIFIYEDADSDDINDNKFVENNNLAPESGAVYVFEIPEDCSLIECSENIVQTAYIKINSNQSAFEQFDNDFGETVLFKDNTLFVTAPKDDNVSTTNETIIFPNSGAVYAYLYSAASDEIWTFSNKFRAPELGNDDKFGFAIDYSNNRLIIGVPNEDSTSQVIINSTTILNSGTVAQKEALLNNANTDSGAAYIFEKTGSTWIATNFIKASNSDSFDLFGTSVSISDSFIAIGASKEDGSGVHFNRDLDSDDSENSGAVYLYGLSSDDNWQETTYIKGPDVQENALFGTKVILENNNLLVSAPLFDLDSVDSGRFYLFSQMDDWAIEAKKTQLKEDEGEMEGEASFKYEHPNITVDGWELNLTLDGLDQPEQFSQTMALSDDKVAISAPNHAVLDPKLKDNTGIVSVYFTE